MSQKDDDGEPRLGEAGMPAPPGHRRYRTSFMASSHCFLTPIGHFTQSDLLGFCLVQRGDLITVEDSHICIITRGS